MPPAARAPRAGGRLWSQAALGAGRPWARALSRARRVTRAGRGTPGGARNCCPAASCPLSRLPRRRRPTWPRMHGGPGRCGTRAPEGLDASRPSSRTNRTRLVPPPVLTGHGCGRGRARARDLIRPRGTDRAARRGAAWRADARARAARRRRRVQRRSSCAPLTRRPPPPPLPSVLNGHVSSLPPVLTGHVSSLSPVLTGHVSSLPPVLTGHVYEAPLSSPPSCAPGRDGPVGSCDQSLSATKAFRRGLFCFLRGRVCN